MNRRQYSFDNSDVDPKEEDEFMTYYRKFRPSMASSSQSLSQASSSSPSFSQLSDYQGRLNHHGTSSGGSVKSSEGGGGGSIFKRKWYQTKKRIQQLPKSRSMEERSSSIRTPSRHHPPGHPHLQTSPLGGLTGMLSDKMTFSSSNSASTSLGHQSGSEGEVDSQSRDSGHSSGGSPDLRGLRKRRSAPPQPLMNYGREWYHQRQNALAGGYSQVKPDLKY